MFDYVERRPLALAPDDVATATPAVLAKATQAAPLALAPGRWRVTSPVRTLQMTSVYELTMGPDPKGGSTLVEVRVRASLSVLAWLVLAVCFCVFFPSAITLLLVGRERFRREARLGASSIFASLGTTSGLVAAGYAPAPM
jgi:hypothetical protein